MFALTTFTEDGGTRILDKFEGYLEANLFQGTLSSWGSQFKYDKQKIGVHKCNQDDRRHFYDESD